MRHARVRPLLLLGGLFSLVAWMPALAADNTLTPEEKVQGWKLLFDGTSLAGWEVAASGKKEAWSVQDGLLYCSGKGGFLLRTTEEYADFILSVDFKLSPGANSGIFVHWSDLGDWLNRSVEVQILDSAGKAPNRNSCASIYDYQAPRVDASRPVGEWNRMVIVCKGSIIAVEHNGRKVCEIDRDQWTTPGKNPDGSKNKFKYALRELPRRGYIALQDHGNALWFKNIKIRPLK